MADRKQQQDEREQSARAQLAEIKERVQTRLNDLAETDADIKRQMRALQRQQNQSDTARELLAWILNGDPPQTEEPEAEESEDEASEESEGGE